MASPIALQLYPSRSNSMPRKSSLKTSRQTNTNTAGGQLEGVAWQITTGPPKSEPAADRTMLPAPPTSPPASSANSSQGARRRHDARQRSRPSSIAASNCFSTDRFKAQPEENKLSPLPENLCFASGSPPRRRPLIQLKQLKNPSTISIEAQLDTDHVVGIESGDRLSPLPEKTHFSISSPSSSAPEYPIPLSVRSASPALARSNSNATSLPSYSPGHAPQMRSIFPQYDSSRPVNDQHYYPTAQAQTQALPSEKVSKLSSPILRSDLKRYDSAVAMVEGYEHIPAAGRSDIEAVWKASNGCFPIAGRKVQLQMHQPRDHDMSLAIGISSEELLYSVDKVLPSSSSSTHSKVWKELAVERHSLRNDTAAPVAQLAIPGASMSRSEKEKAAVSIFPQTAAIQALEAVANSPAAAEIAVFDPVAKSPEATRLACDAVAEARRRHGCELVRTTRKRDSLGTMVATYSLEHPNIGSLPITITKSTAGTHVQDPRAKISLHHPNATPAAISAQNLVLASLDFARDACVLDVPGLLALDSQYVIDTAVSALLAVAFLEKDALTTELVTFAPPPKTPIADNTDSRKMRKLQRRRSKTLKKAREDLVGEQVELPALTSGTIALLSFGLRGAVVLLETGVKLTAHTLISVSHLAQRL